MTEESSESVENTEEQGDREPKYMEHWYPVNTGAVVFEPNARLSLLVPTCDLDYFRAWSIVENMFDHDEIANLAEEHELSPQGFYVITILSVMEQSDIIDHTNFRGLLIGMLRQPHVHSAHVGESSLLLDLKLAKHRAKLAEERLDDKDAIMKALGAQKEEIYQQLEWSNKAHDALMRDIQSLTDKLNAANRLKVEAEAETNRLGEAIRKAHDEIEEMKGLVDKLLNREEDGSQT